MLNRTGPALHRSLDAYICTGLLQFMIFIIDHDYFRSFSLQFVLDLLYMNIGSTRIEFLLDIQTAFRKTGLDT